MGVIDVVCNEVIFVRIISYRGPAVAGGVSSALTQLFNLPTSENVRHLVRSQPHEWWYLQSENDANSLVAAHASLDKRRFAGIDSTLVENHYRYCNNFLWPVFHDLPQFAHFDEIEREQYLTLNAMIAFQLRKLNETPSRRLFVNDYQLAILPRFLGGTAETLCFWHIPWPKHVQDDHVSHVSEIASGLLHCSRVGFHTDEYRKDFLAFIETHMPQFSVDFESNTIEHQRSQHVTSVLVAPLGINSEHWQRLSWESARTDFHVQFGLSNSQAKAQTAITIPAVQEGGTVPYILSVDRADYTKGIVERLDAIDQFFESFPEYVGRLQFVQIATKTRVGLSAFDQYLSDCRAALNRVNQRWQTEGWLPIAWSEEPHDARELAALYRNATMMIVSPLRDGLNLTAKEYIACQTSRSGVLALSKGAGVFTELGRHAVSVDPLDAQSFANSIYEGLSLSATEQYRRMRLMTDRLNSNSLIGWWHSFAGDSFEGVEIRTNHKYLPTRRGKQGVLTV